AYWTSYRLVFDALSPHPSPSADRTDRDAPAPARPIANRPEPDRGPAPAPGLVAQHQRTVEGLVHSYNEIADGYAQIRDAASIAQGQPTVDSGVRQLAAASAHGRSLPPLQPADRAAVARAQGPALLGSVDRVIQELQRLKSTPGLRSDFDGLIAAYLRTRQ